jgi:prepilin-type N-terminal cleavage/methylation domain-containing protein
MRHGSRQRGFGLIETLVALALTSIVVIGLFTAFTSSQRATNRVTMGIEHRQNTRTALQLVEHDVRMAGSGWGREAVEGAYGGQPLTVFGIATGYGGTPTSDDTIGIMGAWDVATTLRAQMQTKTSVIRATNVAGFSDGDFCVVTNGDDSHLFKITNVNKTNNNLVHDVADTYNAAGGHLNWPVNGYATGAKVYRVSWVSFSVDATGKQKQLVRWQAGWPKQVVANDVTRFIVNYRLTGDSLVRNPADFSLVERIEPVLYTTLISPSRPPLPDSAWASIRPRSF